MSDIALRVQGLGKQYRLGLQDNAAGGMYRYKSLRDSFGNLARRPWQTLTAGRGPMTDANSFWALKDIDFEVKKGEVVGIIGRNGAGKSTLLKILSRITKPTIGRVDLYGRVGSLLEVGTGFHPELSGRENIYLNGAILGMTRAEVRAKFDEIVAFSEVEKFLDMAVKQYSSGMYMRLAFAVAAHLDPEILVVDEVLAVGDVEFQRKCLGKMKDVAAQGRTVIFVSHDLRAVRELCHSAQLLKQGRIVAAGGCRAVVDRYMREADLAGGSGASEHPSLQTVSLTGEDGRPSRLYEFGESMALDIEIAPTHPLGAVHLVIELLDPAGRRISALCSREEGVSSLTVGERLKFSHRISGLIYPGRYSVDVTLNRTLSHERVFHAPAVAAFEVRPRSLPGAAYPYDKEHGVARLLSDLQVSAN